MGGTGVIDNFLGVFTRYIDSGFGLVHGDVRWLSGVLIAIDITLAGIFWAMAPDEDVLARLIRKTLYIGVFAFIIGNFNNLAQIVYNSFAGLGIKAGGGSLSQAQLLQPGRLAQVGITAGKPILISISGLMGFTSFFDNFLQIAILLIAWLIVVISFFIMAIQLFVSLIEFKLTTLAGFVLVPFGLLGRTAFLAEKVLGNVVSSGVKVLVLAVIVGIGSTIFGQFTNGFVHDSPTGQVLLIPQGARLIGQYDAQVSFGQSRALLVWNRLIMPNGRSIVLERQPGADALGQAGLEDEVDNHWGMLFKAAILSTLLSVGSEAGTGNNENSLVQAIRQGTSQSVNQAGEQLVGRSLNVQPTITIRPGFPVRVMVTHDLVLEPYRS